MDSSLPEITETILDAAAQILLHSFAVYRVEEATAAKIRTAYRAAVKFFRETSIETTSASSDGVNANSKKSSHIERYRRVKNGNLYGYNLPLPSKELFRTWYGSNSNGKNDQQGQGLDYFRQQQPWPSTEFCEASFHLAKDLHRLLSKCLEEISILDCGKETREENYASFPKPAQDHFRPQRPIPPPRKRVRLSPDAIPADLENTSSSSAKGRIRYDCDENKSSGWPSFFPSICPLDYFFYHNKIPNVVNCSEHIDRGALVVVCFTDVPGLEVRSRATSFQESSFFCPEVLVHNANLYRERSDDANCRHGVVCILAGDQLSRLLSSANRNPGACVHRVRNPLERARLSISYELRLDGL